MRAGLRLLSFLLLSVLGLGGCTLLHPHRITNPNLPPSFKEQQRAARRAQKNSLRAADNEAKARRKKAQNPDADNDTGSASSGAAPTATAAASDGQATRVGADKSTVKYDKHGLMKKPKLKHRRYYKPAPQPFRPWQRFRDLFKKNPQRHHGKSKSSKPAPKAPTSPTPAPVDTGLTP